MAAGGMHEPVLTVAWPTGELGGMGLESGPVGFRPRARRHRGPAERQEREAALIELAYLRGGAPPWRRIEIDDVIDPADTRRRILGALLRQGRRRGQVMAMNAISRTTSSTATMIQGQPRNTSARFWAIS